MSNVRDDLLTMEKVRAMPEDDRWLYLFQKLDAVNSQVEKTNGRVTKMEKTLAYLKGGIAAIAALSPFLALMLSFVLDQVGLKP